MSPGPQDDLQNPYNQLLVDAVADSTVTETFRWSAALFGRWDVLHIHWPEAILYGTSRPKKIAKAVLFVLVMARAKLLRRPLVWTVHNVSPHEPLDAIGRLAYAAWASQVSARIHLSRETLILRRRHRAQDVVIPHGIYPEPSTTGQLHSEEAGGLRLLFFGAIRAYKRVPELVRAFTATTDDWRLTVAGEPINEEIEQQLILAARGDARVDLVARRLSDGELEENLGAADGVVLPYDGLINSGALLLALSRALPVLVPRSPSVEAIASEVGDGWIMTFDGEITDADLSRFFHFVCNVERSKPNLDSRNWQHIGAAHSELYRKLAAG
jgi:beta-1,4-mannosyltransferase